MCENVDYFGNLFQFRSGPSNCYSSETNGNHPYRQMSSMVARKEYQHGGESAKSCTHRPPSKTNLFWSIVPQLISQSLQACNLTSCDDGPLQQVSPSVVSIN